MKKYITHGMTTTTVNENRDSNSHRFLWTEPCLPSGAVPPGDSSETALTGRNTFMITVYCLSGIDRFDMRFIYIFFFLTSGSMTKVESSLKIHSQLSYIKL